MICIKININKTNKKKIKTPLKFKPYYALF